MLRRQCIGMGVTLSSNSELIDKILIKFKDEMLRAVSLHGPFRSAHEGYGIMLEEFDEMWDAVKLKENNPSRFHELESEAVQVGAMALRFLIDVVYGGDEQ